jgi:uncharacterized protein (DUF58 family)
VSGNTRLLASLALALAVLSLAFLDGRVMALSLPFLAYLGAEGLNRRQTVRLEVQRSLQAPRVSAGIPMEVRVSVRNVGFGIEDLLLSDGIPRSLQVMGGSPRFLTSLPQGGTIAWTYTVSGGRGEYVWEGLHAEACGHCGTAVRTVDIPTGSRLLVLPASFRLPRIAIRPRQTRGFAGPIQARVAGAGVLMFGVREYRMGDPLRRVNWRLTSRDPRTVFVNEQEQERIADVGIVVDARSGSYRHPAGGVLFEAVVSAAGSMAERFLADGNRVALLVYGHGMDRVMPGYGRAQAQKIRQRLAGARTGTNYALESLVHLPTRLFPARSQLVLVSPLQQGDAHVLHALRGLGYALLVVSPDPDSAHPAGVGTAPSEIAVRLARLERNLITATLRRAGAGVLEWRLDADPAAALRTALTRRNDEPWAGVRP